MFELWDQEPTEEEVADAIATTAQKIRKRKMETPAIMALEMHKPLAYVGAHAAIGFSPFLISFFGFDAVNRYTRVFSKRENVERLIEELEKPADNEGSDSRC